MISSEEIQFKHPFCMTIARPTESGKSYFVYNLLRNRQDLIIPASKKIIFIQSGSLYIQKCLWISQILAREKMSLLF